MKPIQAPKVTDLKLIGDDRFSALVNGRKYYGSFWQFGSVKAVTEMSEQNRFKQTTLRIKMAAETVLNR